MDVVDLMDVVDGKQTEGVFRAQGLVMVEAPVDVQIPADVLARIKTVDPEPFLVSGMVSEAGTVVNGVLYTPALLKEMAAQLPTVQHPEHMDHERGAFARRPNASYMLAGALTPDGKRLFGKAWIPASQAELVAEVKAGFAAGLPPAWSTECHSKLVRRGDHFEPVPGTAKLISIDWVETGRPGVPGAGPTRVISAQKQTPKEEKMDEEQRKAFMASLTLESLTAGRKDLVEGIISAQATSAAEKTELETLRAENKELKTKVATFEAATLTAQLNTKRTELLSAVKDEKLRNIADGLLSGQSVADLDANWPKVQERIKPLLESMPIVHGGDQGKKKPDGLNF